MFLRKSGSTGFTLIELLIVIAIILILIAIALPNFLEAQIRARVTKATGEIRSIGIALESYYLDWNYYPFESEPDWATQSATERGLKRLTTPIKYMSEIPHDPFPNVNEDQSGEELFYYGGGCRAFVGDFAVPPQGFIDWGPIYAVWSQGPAQQGANIQATHPNCNPLGGGIVSYSATNGTKSAGSIHLFTGDGRWWGMDTQSAGDVCDPEVLKNNLIAPLIVDNVPYVRQRPPNSFN